MGYLCRVDPMTKKYFRAQRIDELDDNGSFIVKSRSVYYRNTEKLNSKVDFRVLERETTLAMKTFLGPMAHEHYNIKTVEAKWKD